MISERYRSPREPVRHERPNSLTGTNDIWFTCGKCMSVLVEMKCLHCERKHPTINPEEAKKMSEIMDKIVAEYNGITGKSIRRFASVAIGEARLEKVKFQKENPTIKPPKVEKVRKTNLNEKMADAVRNSWDDEGIATRRGQRHSAHVDGHGEFPSVSKAFKHLGIKCKSLIAFRMKLKKAGALVYDHNGTKYHFRVTLKTKPTKKEAIAVS